MIISAYLILPLSLVDLWNNVISSITIRQYHVAVVIFRVRLFNVDTSYELHLREHSTKGICVWDYLLINAFNLIQFSISFSFFRFHV